VRTVNVYALLYFNLSSCQLFLQHKDLTSTSNLVESEVIRLSNLFTYYLGPTAAAALTD